MAEVFYLQDEDGDSSDEGHNTSEPEMGAENRDDFLPPLIRIQKYCTSENIYHRQMVARMLLETLRAVADEPSDVASVISVVNKLADDPEGSVRAELMEHVPHIAMLCHEDKGRLHSLILDHLLPLIVKYLADNDNQVRKTSQAALLILMEQGLIEQTAVEEKVCPVILMLSEMDSFVEFHTGAVVLMSKMAPLIGRNSTERLFLGRFAALCTDQIFYVRKVCAANFGEFCAVVGTDATENILLPRFVDLCEDEVWGVRKSCAETFMSVSCACTLAVRKQTLAPLFTNLLVDQSRWVRMSAFQTLGPFISTFADPSITGLSYNQDGELVIMSPEGFEFRLNSSHMSENECARFLADVKSCTRNFNRNEMDENATNSNDVIEYHDSNKLAVSSESAEVDSGSYDIELGGRVCNERTSDEEDESTNSVERREISVTDASENAQRHVELSDFKSVNENEQLRVTESKGQVHIHVGNSILNGPESFNTFQYWRVPIPELELDISLAETGKPKAVHVKAKVMDETNQRTYASELNVEMEIETELENLSSRLEECSLQKVLEDKPMHAQICTSSVSMMTDTRKTGADSKIVVASNLQKSVIWLSSGEVKVTSPEKKTEDKQIGSESWGYLRRATEQWERQQREAAAAVAAAEAAAAAAAEAAAAVVAAETAPVVETTPQVSQDIVPQQLIDHFVSMTHPSQAHKTDNEISHHCAYSLPAVALTLGRENWDLLKDAYNTLASDMQWKVRRTVASSIHELAVILGEDLATKDLVPIFNGFIKDLDEVRIGALKHLAEFLKLLRPQERNSYLPRLSEFMLTDNEWNWRFREELAEQLLEAVNLFSPEDTRKHITPIAISLLLDKVAAVRQVALSLVTELVRHVSAEPGLLRSLLAELAEWFAHSKRWNRRQTFALLCSHLIVKHILPEELFAKDILPHLLDLSWDPVPNVRLSVARTISTNIMKQEFFSSEGNPHHEVLMQVLKRLQADFDRDVRYFALLCPGTNVEEEPEKASAGHT